MSRRYVKTNELYHYGVKGMRWGVRRARKQNEKIAVGKAIFDMFY